MPPNRISSLSTNSSNTTPTAIVQWAPGTQPTREDPAVDAQALDIGTGDIPLSDEVPPDKAPPARTTQRTAT